MFEMSTAAVSISKMFAEKPFPKPCSSPVIRCLFENSDRKETKKMLDEMLLDESTRLRSVWNFDAASAGKRDKNSGENDAKIPMSTNQRFVNWERQDRKSVPHYYSRPFHRHRSELRNSERNSSLLSSSTKSEILAGSSPLPLACRNENLMNPRQRGPSKSTPIFASPPRISSESVNPSLVRFVTALKAPLPAMNSQCHSISDENKPKEIADSQPAIRLHSLASHDPPKKQAFRQLFEEKTSRKRSFGSTSTLQPKITGECLF